MPFRSVREVADAVEQGRHHTQHFIRTGFNGAFGVGNVFGDASIGSGSPNYNAYLGNALEATQMIGAGNRSIYVGPGINRFIELEKVIFFGGCVQRLIGFQRVHYSEQLLLSQRCFLL